MIVRRGQRAHTLMIVLVLMPIAVACCMALMNSTDMQVRQSRQEVSRYRAELAADNALNRLIASPAMLVEGKELTFEFAPGESATGTAAATGDGRWSLALEGQLKRPHGTYKASISAELERAADGTVRIVSFRRF